MLVQNNRIPAKHNTDFLFLNAVNENYGMVELLHPLILNTSGSCHIQPLVLSN
jgi:hypothetical protein